MKTKILFCSECRKDVECKIKDLLIKESLKGSEYEYMGKKALCNECGNEIYLPEIVDYNLKALYDAYRIKNDIISLENIQSIPEKYDIGKRPLSVLLGWGEMTFSRYCDGYLPTKQYSELLKELSSSPQKYLDFLEKYKDRLKSHLSYTKSKAATKALIESERKSKIDLVVNYLLCKCEDVTPLALQKLLYYVQGFCFAFTGENLFNDDCEAWVHGPVYKDIYYKYSHYQFDPIKPVCICSELPFMEVEKAVVDSVIRYFGCYSGKMLEKFTHSEKPWLETRGDLSENEPSSDVIPKNMIKEYFTTVKSLHKMLNPSDIQNYSEGMFKKIS